MLRIWAGIFSTLADGLNLVENYRQKKWLSFTLSLLAAVGTVAGLLMAVYHLAHPRQTLEEQIKEANENR